MANVTERIPNEWKNAVRKILQRPTAASLIVTSRARLDWESTFPETFEYQRNEAIASSLLAQGIEGKRIEGMTPPGEVWAFYTIFQQRKIYTKINLRPDGKIVILYSAHPPLKGDSL